MTHVEDLLAKIPNHIKVFIIPGNHDQGEEPCHNHHCQEKILINLYSLENFTMLGNPSFVRIKWCKSIDVSRTKS